MIEINSNASNKIKNLKFDNLYFVADFDRTLTLGNSDSSWGMLSKSNKVPREYVGERQNLYNFYHPIELDNTLDYDIKNKLMIEWWSKHISLLIKYQMSEEVIKDAATNLRVMAFRDGAREFLEKMYKHQVPIIIISAGIGNFIQQFLINNDCYYNNIHIVSNLIEFENGIATGIKGNVIHSLNKDEVLLHEDIVKAIESRQQIILLGDSLGDIKMVPITKRDQTIRIGFLDENVEANKDIYMKEFDLVCTNNTSYNDLMEILEMED